MRINIIYVRHGFSCANSIQYLGGKWQQYKRLLYKDPPLTDYAIAEIRAFRDHIRWGRKLDVICASTMLRAIQTACEIFPKRKILVVPWAKEAGRSAGNVVGSVDDQKKQLGPSTAARVDFRFAEHAGRAQSDLASFKTWLADHLDDIIPKSSKSDEVSIVVVSHSHFMKKHLGGALPKNLEAIMFPYDFDGEKLRVAGRRQLLFEGRPIPDKDTFVEQKGDKSCRYQV